LTPRWNMRTTQMRALALRFIDIFVDRVIRA
jgi:hypothetical protein